MFGMFNIRVKKYAAYLGPVIDGKDALNCKPGTILEVDKSSCSNKGDTIIRLDDYNIPFKTILIAKGSQSTIGSLWGNAIEGYKFREVFGAKKDNYDVKF